MITVTLTPFEVQQVALVGVMRRVASLDRQDTHGFRGSRAEEWGMDIEGAGAEYAVAKRRGTFWNAVVEPASVQALPGDVGDVQVRSTARTGGALLLHKSDPADARFILVVGVIPTFRLVGWTLAWEAWQPDFWREDTGRPCFFVPQWFLSPIGRETPAQRDARLAGNRPVREGERPEQWAAAA